MTEGRVTLALFVVAACSGGEPARVTTRPGSPPDARAVEIVVDPLPDDDKSDYTPRASLTDPLTWPRATSRQFGCLLERAGHRDATFHCTAPRPPQGDACKDIEPYYAGPEFPAALIPRVGHRIQKISLDWEHGDLQAVTLIFEPGVDEHAIDALFDITSARRRNVNLSGTSVQHCARDAWCLLLIGFDHMGAADVECPK